jgi:hypothetical protein
MTEEQKNEQVEDENELEDEDGELLPDREVMSILDIGGGVAGAPGKLPPPLLDQDF